MRKSTDSSEYRKKEEKILKVRKKCIEITNTERKKENGTKGYHTKINTAIESTIKAGSLAAKQMSHNWL